MGEELFTHNGMTATKFAGPDRGPGQERRLVQFDVRTAGPQGYVSLTFTAEQWETLAEFFTSECSSECGGPNLWEPMPDNWRWQNGP